MDVFHSMLKKCTCSEALMYFVDFSFFSCFVGRVIRQHSRLLKYLLSASTLISKMQSSHEELSLNMVKKSSSTIFKKVRSLKGKLKILLILVLSLNQFLAQQVSSTSEKQFGIQKYIILSYTMKFHIFYCFYSGLPVGLDVIFKCFRVPVIRLCDDVSRPSMQN